MPTRDIVVIGGSAGSVEAIREVVQSLPHDLSAAVFIVLHLSPRQRSFLASIVSAAGGLPTQEAREGDRIEPRHIYVATPDRHLLIARDHIHLPRGPKEGLQRPSINVTFRSAAAVYGKRVLGVLLSGMLDDGAAGLWEIAWQGGVAIVQDPDDALFPSMPMNAIQDAEIDYKLRAAEIGEVVGKMVNGELEPAPRNPPGATGEEEFSGLTCPECHGPLYTMKTSGPIGFRCRVGHRMSLEMLLDESTSLQERKLYEALLALEEGSDLAEFAAKRTEAPHRESFFREAEDLRKCASAIREMIERRDVPKVS